MTARSALGVLAIAIAATGCSHLGPSRDAQTQSRYEAYGPKFSEEEIQSMSIDQRLAIYNYNVPLEQQLVCRSERPVGTHFKMTRCWTRAEFELQQQAAEAFMRASRRGSSF